MSRREEIEKLITEHQRHLNILKQQAAGYGSLNVPTHVVTQIQDRETTIERLQKELARGEDTSSPVSTATSTTHPTLTPNSAALPSGSIVNTGGGWALRVIDVKYSDRLEKGNLVYIAKGRYVHLILEATNNNRRTKTFISSGKFELVIGSGFKYNSDDFASIINKDVYGIEFQNRPINLKPGEKGFDVVSFDIPVDSYGPYILQEGLLENFDAKVLVDVL